MLSDYTMNKSLSISDVYNYFTEMLLIRPKTKNIINIK
jgi:hypothetical protein